MEPMPLEKEIRTYTDKLPELLAHEGKFVVIHEDKVAGYFETYGDALRAGYEQFQFAPFLVKKIQAVEEPMFIAWRSWPTWHSKSLPAVHSLMSRSE